MEGAALAAGVHGFPVVLTSFVGREQAVREVAGLLEGYRLVTVTGPGGVGKTRLAGAVARRMAARFADGAWLAGLAPVWDPAQVGGGGGAGGAAAAGGVRAVAAARVLARRQLLVVLDNCEHVIGAAAELCAGLLQACDDIRILATSREPLRIEGEAAYRLAPLPVPSPGDADDWTQAGAVALFADRARAADAGFALTDENRADVARLVGRLDGIPLAIELAAARAEALGVSQLLGWLDGRLGLPAGGDRLAAGRHRSLAAAAEWRKRHPPGSGGSGSLPSLTCRPRSSRSPLSRPACCVTWPRRLTCGQGRRLSTWDADAVAPACGSRARPALPW